jgi:hypothetical protein
MGCRHSELDLNDSLAPLQYECAAPHLCRRYFPRDWERASLYEGSEGLVSLAGANLTEITDGMKRL